MAARSVEDRLRDEYFGLLPDIQRAGERLETEIRYHLREISGQLNEFERVVVKSRVKECESAISKLRHGQQGAVFDPDRPEDYRLQNLNDLAGVRVLAFPRRLVTEIDGTLRNLFPEWTSDPVLDDRSEVLAFKYHGYSKANVVVSCEYQVVSMLTGLFWEVEHAAIYKPAPRFRGAALSPRVQEHSANVLLALREFEEVFEDAVSSSSQ
jgi:ppGpp synthetase/RelA/SpoT-type nucleotidyltranferase